MSWSKIPLVLAATILAACSPSPEPAPQVAATEIPPGPPAPPLPTDFLGLALGQPHGLEPCDVNAPPDRMFPCLDHAHRAALDPRQVPTGLEPWLTLATDAAGALESIDATVSRGHSGTIADALIAKYGQAQLEGPHGSLQWSDGAIVVTYYPATLADPGFVVVETAAHRAAKLSRLEQAQNRPL